MHSSTYKVTGDERKIIYSIFIDSDEEDRWQLGRLEGNINKKFPLIF